MPITRRDCAPLWDQTGCVGLVAARAWAQHDSTEPSAGRRYPTRSSAASWPRWNQSTTTCRRGDHQAVPRSGPGLQPGGSLRRCRRIASLADYGGSCTLCGHGPRRSASGSPHPSGSISHKP